MRKGRNQGRTHLRFPCLFAFQEGGSMRTESRSCIICIEVAEPLYVVEAAFKAKDLFLPDDPHCGPYYWAWDGCSHWLGRPPGAGLEPWSRCWLWRSTDLDPDGRASTNVMPFKAFDNLPPEHKEALKAKRVHFHTSPRLAEEFGSKRIQGANTGPDRVNRLSGEEQTQSIWLGVCQIKVVGMKSASREYSISSFPSSWLVSYPSFLALYPIMSVNRCWNPPWERLQSGAPAQRPWNTAIRFHRAVSEVSYIGNLCIQSYFNCMMAAEIKSEPHDSQNKVHQNISGRGQAGSKSRDLGTRMNSVKLTMARNCRRFRWAKRQGSGLPEPNAARFNHFWGNVPSRSWAWTWSWNKTLGSVVWL